MVKRLIFILLTLLANLEGKGKEAGEMIEVSANQITSNQDKVVLNGQVLIQKQKDILRANQVIINLGKDKKPSRYEAVGDVSFSVTTNDGRMVDGSAKKVIYDAISEEYRLLGKARLKERAKSNAIKGERIIFNRKNGGANIEGDKKKPAKIIFSLEGDGK